MKQPEPAPKTDVTDAAQVEQDRGYHLPVHVYSTTRYQGFVKAAADMWCMLCTTVADVEHYQDMGCHLNIDDARLEQQTRRAEALNTAMLPPVATETVLADTEQPDTAEEAANVEEPPTTQPQDEPGAGEDDAADTPDDVKIDDALAGAQEDDKTSDKKPDKLSDKKTDKQPLPPPPRGRAANKK